MKPLRVVHVLNRIALGGTEYNVLKLANRLDRSRFTPILCSLRDSLPEARALVAPDIPVWEFHRKEGLDRGLLPRLARRFRDEGVDVVHSHNWSTFLYTVVAARLAGVRAIIHGEHGLEAENLVETRRRVLARRILARMTDHFTCVSREIAARMTHRWGVPADSITYIPNGVDLGRFGQPYAGEPIRRGLGLEPGDRVISSIGNFRPVKDHATLIRAFEAVQCRRPDTRLILVGFDPENAFETRMRSEPLARPDVLDRIRSLGVRLDTPEILSITDVYVNCSLYEGMSNTILEAMGSRLPVVATKVGGTPDLVVDGENGLLVPPGDPGAVAAAILRLLEDPGAAAAMGQRGRERVERNHSFDRMIAINADTYETVHGLRARKPRSLDRAKTAAARASRTLGITALAERSSSGSLVVLTYHRILPYAEKQDSPFKPMVVTSSVFEHQMEELARRYRPLSLDEVIAHYRDHRPFPARAVHVTFDDGYRDNLEHALPVLTRCSIPATLFLTTDPLDAGTPLWWDDLAHSIGTLRGRASPEADRLVIQCPERLRRPLRAALSETGGGTSSVAACIRLLNHVDEETRRRVVAALRGLAGLPGAAPPPRLMLNWNEVRAMHRAGVALGGHTARHAFLDELDDPGGIGEVSLCLSRIQAETGERPRTFAYPAGRSTSRSRGWLRQAGVELAMTTVRGTNRCGDDPYAVKRWDGSYLAAGDRFVAALMEFELSGLRSPLVRVRTYP